MAPAARQQINQKMDSILAVSRDPVPKRVRFTTWTLRYNQMLWVRADGLEEHWKRARIDAEITGPSTVEAKTENVSALSFGMGAGHCPLDNTLFGFKGVKGADFKAQIENGASDQQMAEWLDANGEKKTPEEIKRWGDEVEAASLYNDPEKREYFAEECQKLGLDPAKTPTFDWLEADDKASHAQKAA